MSSYYKKPIIFELGNVEELTAGGKSVSGEKNETSCYDYNNNVINHYYIAPKSNG